MLHVPIGGLDSGEQQTLPEDLARETLVEGFAERCGCRGDPSTAVRSWSLVPVEPSCETDVLTLARPAVQGPSSTPSPNTRVAPSSDQPSDPLLVAPTAALGPSVDPRDTRAKGAETGAQTGKRDALGSETAQLNSTLHA